MYKHLAPIHPQNKKYSRLIYNSFQKKNTEINLECILGPKFRKKYISMKHDYISTVKADAPDSILIPFLRV